MSKFLSLVAENTPGEEQESLADKFHSFADKVSALEKGRNVDVDELLLELNGLNEELTTLGGVPEAEDAEFMDNRRQKKVDRLNKNVGNIANTLNTANEYRAADPDPSRPSRGVKKVEKAVAKLGNAVSGAINKLTKNVK